MKGFIENDICQPSNDFCPRQIYLYTHKTNVRQILTFRPDREIFKQVQHLRDRVHGNLVSLAVGFRHGRVVGVLVRDEVRRLDVAPVRVLALAVEDLLVQIDVVVVDGIVEGDGDHHWDVLGRQVPGDGGTVLGAEAIGQYADGRIARWCAVWIAFDVCGWA